MPTPVGIVRIAEQRRRQAEQRGREDRRQNGRRARVRQLAHLGAHELESVPHPAAKPRHHAGEAGLGPDAAAKQKRQKRANEHSAQMPILIAPGFLHLGEHRVHIIGVRPHVLLKQSNGNAAHNAEGKRVHDSGHPYRRQPRRRLHPQKIEARVHEKEERPAIRPGASSEHHGHHSKRNPFHDGFLSRAKSSLDTKKAPPRRGLLFMVVATGFEPVTPAV